MIKFLKEEKTFFLTTENSTYAMKILDNGMLVHWYYGEAIPCENMDNITLMGHMILSPLLQTGRYLLSKDDAMSEYPTFGRGDFRGPALVIENSDGRRVNDLIYKKHRIMRGKPQLEGLPSFDVAAEKASTLEITMEDIVSKCKVKLYYSVFAEEDAITRHAVIHNTTRKAVTVANAQSFSVDFQGEDYELISLHGTWARERHINRQKLYEGTVSIESRRGASGHQHNPFVALVSPDTNEDLGKAFGFSLVYSGNYKMSAELDPLGTVRIEGGINPFNFSYRLERGESFTTPEAVMVYSNKGLNGMSHSFHNMCRNHLGKSADKNLKRPLLINCWEAMYFDISEEKIKKFVEGCKGLGLDTFVMDDGWFGHREREDSSLGDWFVHKDKFPNGLHNVIDICHKNGLNFGIWFEPEMISVDSELYKKHPDWCIHIEGIAPVESRNQLILDFARQEVVDAIYDQMHAFLTEYDISYIKWDMNRNMTDNGSASLPANRQGEHAHRYILGVYKLMDRLNKAFPNVLFEGCSGGGGRFDFGLLYYMPQFWTSDDTDAIERLKIQYGTSLVYPPSAMTAHVSASPNHQTFRSCPFKTRGDVAQAFNFGYELDINKLSDEEKAQVKTQIEMHKRIEPMIYDGDFYRIDNPFHKNHCSWQLVSADKKTSFAMFAVQTASPQNSGAIVKFKGLDPKAIYTVKTQFGEKPYSIESSGSMLMNAGFPINRFYYTDHFSLTFELSAI